jgi:2OG-Fe(II) oxygenase superfamily
LYFNDLPDGAGGETLFSKVWPHNLPIDQRIQTKDMIRKLRESGEIDMLKPGSWEEEMVANCRTKLAIKPHATRAVLFYSQYPNGEQDPWSYHGGCPVTSNISKYAANLWTWSGIRPEFEGAPLKRGRTIDEIQSKENKQLRATFSNIRKHADYDNAQLFYNENIFFGNLGPDDNPITVNTYKGHVWNVKDKQTEKILATFVVDGSAEQVFSV